MAPANDRSANERREEMPILLQQFPLKRKRRECRLPLSLEGLQLVG